MSKIFILATLVLLGCSTQKKIEVNNPYVGNVGRSYSLPNKTASVNFLLEPGNMHKPKASVVKGRLRPGAILNAEALECCDRIYYFEKAAGEVTIGNDNRKLDDGDVIYVPAKVKFGYRNRSRKTANFIEVFAPAGPEQKYKSWVKD